ncbi:MAG: sulfatase-like hydrolase/transferase [Pseudomonadota bacterium]
MSARKNILLISLDDAFSYWKYRSAFGAELKTPNLDRICAQSTAFHSAYCQVPVCGPSRSSLMSGLTPHQLGIFDNYTNVFDVLRTEQMWSYRLKQDGYYCANAGKVHHRFKPLPDPIHNVLYSHPPEHLNIGPGKNAKIRNYGGLMKGHGTTDPAYDNRYYDAQSAASAERFLQDYDRPEPFYREVGFYHPHSPYKTPARFKEMYDEATFLQPDAWGAHDKNAFADQFMAENLDNSDLTLWRKSVRNYFSAFSHVDEHLGRVWDALKASDHADNTVVILLADHGYHPGDKNRFRKYTLYEEAAGVPVIIHDPARPKGRVVTDPVALLDIGPTVLDYADCPPLQHCAGQSLRAQVEGAQNPDRAVPTFFFGSASIRKGAYRYTRYLDGSTQLFDLDADPWQLDNLADHAAQPDMHRALLRTCRRYGLEFVDSDAATPDPNHYCSVLQGTLPPDTLTGQGAVSVGSLTNHDTSPGYRKQFAILRENGTLGLAEGARALYLAADHKTGANYFGVCGNDHGNTFNFIGGHNRFVLDIACGDGDDTILGHLDLLRARLNAGDNTVLTGHTGSEVYAGSGHDRIETSDGHNTIHGGTGDMEVITGKGHDIITVHAGTNRIHCSDGTTDITLGAGKTRIDITGGDITLRVLRTGLPQTVIGLADGHVDLSDWDVLGPITVTLQDNGDSLATAGGEVIRFVATPPDIVKSAIMAGPL